jgi:hypothetical protein
MRRILFCLLIFFSAAAAAFAQVTHYTVKLTADFDTKVFLGEETIAFHHDVGDRVWQKQAGLQISGSSSSDGDVLVSDEKVVLHRRDAIARTVHLKYTAATGRGIQWFADKAGFDTAFYCEA